MTTTEFNAMLKNVRLWRSLGTGVNVICILMNVAFIMAGTNPSLDWARVLFIMLHIGLAYSSWTTGTQSLERMIRYRAAMLLLDREDSKRDQAV